MTQLVEDSYPVGGSLLVSALVCVFLFTKIETPWQPAVLQGFGTLFPSALNISAIAVGFLTTSQSILFSLGRSRLIREMRAAGHYARLLRFLNAALANSFVWAVLSAWLSTFHLDHGGIWRKAAVCLWSYFCSCSILCYYRASSILNLVLQGEAPTKAIASRQQEWDPDKLGSN